MNLVVGYLALPRQAHPTGARLSGLHSTLYLCKWSIPSSYSSPSTLSNTSTGEFSLIFTRFTRLNKKRIHAREKKTEALQAPEMDFMVKTYKTVRATNPALRISTSNDLINSRGSATYYIYIIYRFPIRLCSHDPGLLVRKCGTKARFNTGSAGGNTTYIHHRLAIRDLNGVNHDIRFGRFMNQESCTIDRILSRY